jgi:hypothetical protein
LGHFYGRVLVTDRQQKIVTNYEHMHPIGDTQPIGLLYA